MSDKNEKTKSSNQVTKHVPKDAQVIMSIMKEMGISDCEPRVINQLMEFIYRYTTCILEDSRIYANHSKKKFIDVEDVRLALQINLEMTFTLPLPREILLETGRVRNSIPLPLIKPHTGLRIPPDRHCLANCNYKAKSIQSKKASKVYTVGNTNMKIPPKSSNNVSCYIKRANSTQISKTQTVTVPRPPATKVSLPTSKTVLKPKIQITQNTMLTTPMDIDEINNLKRKREDSDEQI